MALFAFNFMRRESDDKSTNAGIHGIVAVKRRRRFLLCFTRHAYIFNRTFFATYSFLIIPRLVYRYSISQKASEDGLVGELLVLKSGRADNGLYECKATNPYGESQLSTHVLVEEIPDPPTNLQASEIGSRDVTLKWSMPYTGNSPITKYIIEWKRDKGWARRFRFHFDFLCF